MSEVLSLGEHERWYGDFPRAHEFSTLGNLDADPNNPGSDNFADAAAQVLEHWDGQFAGLYLYGTPGTGKTHRAIGLARELLDTNGDAAVHYSALPYIKKDTDKYVPEVVGDKLTYWTRQGINYRVNNRFLGLHNKHTSRVFRPEDKPVFVLDEYKPEHTRILSACLEVADHTGALVIVTSNYPDPFMMFEGMKKVKTPEQIVVEDLAKHVDPEAMQEQNEIQAKQAKQMSDSLRSRVAANFRFIDLSGPDHRQEKNFWTK